MRPLSVFFHGCLVHFLNNADYASLGTGYYLSPGRGGEEGRGGGLGLNKVKFSRFPVLMLLH